MSKSGLIAPTTANRTCAILTAFLAIATVTLSNDLRNVALAGAGDFTDSYCLEPRDTGAGHMSRVLTFKTENLPEHEDALSRLKAAISTRLQHQKIPAQRSSLLSTGFSCSERVCTQTFYVCEHSSGDKHTTGEWRIAFEKWVFRVQLGEPDSLLEVVRFARGLMTEKKWVAMD